MSSVPKGAAVIGQSGGPTVVINQSLVGFVAEALQHDCFTRVLGARHGVKGMMKGDFLDLGKETPETLERVARTPAAALGSVRQKPTAEDVGLMIQTFRAHEVRHFFYIGGNDSAETAHIVAQQSAEIGRAHV